MEKVIKSTKFQILFIIILTFFSYSNSLSNGLVWDDHLFIEKWKDIQSFNLQSLVQGSAPQDQGGVYRPIRSIIYAIDYKLWGQNPFFYHFQAILIHVAATVLVFYIVRCLRHSGLSRISKKTDSGVVPTDVVTPQNDGKVAFIAALLFGLHPIHTETIDYISASMETFGSLFFFASFYLYLISFARSHLAKLGSLIFALLAFFTYEMTLTLPLLIVLYEICFRHCDPDSNRKKQSLHSSLGIASSLRLLAMTAPYFAAAFFYVFVRLFVLGILSRTDYLAYSFYHTMLTMVKVFARYIFLLIFPFNLTTNHNLVGNFPSSMLPYDKLDPILKQSIFDLDVLLGLLGILGLLALAIKILRKYPIISFCIGWFFISLIPVSYIIPHGGAMAEKYLYIASFGFVLIVAVLVFVIPSAAKGGRGISYSKRSFDSPSTSSGSLRMTILLFLVLFYGIVTLQRNTVWRNDIALFSDMAKKSPYNLLANYTLGVLYGERGDFSNAVLYYQRAINTASDFWEARYNLGNIYSKLGNIDLAKKEYEKVVKLNKDFVPAKNNLDFLSRRPGKPLRSLGEEGRIQNQVPKLVQDDKGDSGVASLPRMTDSVQKPIKYSLEEISFEYPKDWIVERIDGEIIIKNREDNFFVEIKPDKKLETLSTNEYVQKDKDNYGLLVNEGLAKIPYMDWAYVKVWRNRLQFFLFKKDLVVKVLAYPSDSSEMQKFDTMLGSISLNEKK